MPRSGKGRDMGLGLLSGPDLVFKRKYRWTFEIQPYCGKLIPAHFVKASKRPSLNVDETEINFLHGKMWIPGKGVWDELSVTYYDIGNGGDGMGGLFSWLATVYNFTDPVGLHQSSKKGAGVGSGGYSSEGIMQLYDGCGTAMEMWSLKHMWPKSINFGELDYSSSEEMTVELGLRFSEVQYTQLCGGSIDPCCAGC